MIFVVINQPDLKTGKLKLQDLNLMHKQLLNKTKIDQIFVCPHNDADNCECRKPKLVYLFKHLKFIILILVKAI